MSKDSKDCKKKNDKRCCPPGPVGPRGPRGAPGTSPTSHFTYVWASEEATFATNSPVTFENRGPTQGIDASNINIITITRGGVYMVDWQVRARASLAGVAAPIVLEIHAGGAPLPGPNSGGTRFESPPGSSENDPKVAIGSALVRFEAGQEVELVNVGPTFTTIADVFEAVNASLRIVSVALDPEAA